MTVENRGDRPRKLRPSLPAWLRPPAPELQAALNTATLASLLPVTVGVGTLMGFFGLVSLVMVPGVVQPQAIFDLVSAVILLVTARILVRITPPPDLAPAIATAILAFPLASSLLELWQRPNIEQTTNLMLVLVGSAALILSPRWLISFFAVTWGGWIGVVVTRLSGQPVNSHYLFAMVGATVVGSLIYLTRVAAESRLKNEIARSHQAQQTLRESKEFFHSILDNMDDLLWSMKLPSGELAYMNAAVENRYGLTVEHLRERPEQWMRDFVPGNRAATQAQHAQLLGTSGTLEIDHPLVLPTGEVRWMRTRIRTIEDAGRPVRLDGVATDITERRNIEEALRRQNAYLAQLHEIALKLLHRRELDDLLQTIVESASEVLDAPLGELLVKEQEELVVQAVTGNLASLKGDRAGRDEAQLSWQAYDTGQPVVLEDYAEWSVRRTVYDAIEMHATADFPIMLDEACVGVLALARTRPGHLFQAEDIQKGVMLSELAALALDNFNLYNAALREIAERSRAEEIGRRLVTALQATEEAIMITGTNGTIQEVNPAFERLTGYRREEAIGRTPSLLRSGHQDESFYKELWEVLVRGEVWQGTFVNRRKDGSLYHAEQTIAPVRDIDGTIVGYVGAQHDITERVRSEAELREKTRRLEANAQQIAQANEQLAKARDQALEATRAKSQFLATMSHELRTPLNAVIGLTDLLLDTALDTQQREWSETIQQSGEALLAITNDVLDLSKIEAGKLELEEQIFGPEECVQAAVSLVAPAAAAKALPLASHVDPAVPPQLVGDPTRLQQILVNLLSNAVKFTDTGEVTLAVTSTPLEDLRHELHIAVRDTGIGISPNQLARIFEPFVQGDVTTSRRHGGTGLGLAITRHLVEMMGGRIWIDSQVGVGSTVHCTIVAAQPVHGDLERLLAGKQVLVVSDDQGNRERMVRWIESWGAHVSAAANPEEALATLRDAGDGGAGPCCAVILDLRLGEAEIDALLEAIGAAVKPRSPAVVVGAPLDQPSRHVEKGIARFLARPLKASQLYDLLTDSLMRQMQDSALVPAGEHLAGVMATAHPLRILLAEDSVINQKVGLGLLARLGYEADVAANGHEVLAAVSRQQYDVVLMDVEMPEMDGIQAAAALRESLPEDRRPRMIALTAHALLGDRERFLAAGMDEYVSKPVRLAALAAALGRTLPLKDGSPAPGPRPVEAPTVASVPEVLDAEMLADLSALIGGEGSGEFQELLGTFIAYAADKIAAMRDATARGDADGLRQAAHALKSSSGSMAARSLMELCAATERAASSGDLRAAGENVPAIEAEFARVQAAFAGRRTAKAADAP